MSASGELQQCWRITWGTCEMSRPGNCSGRERGRDRSESIVQVSPEGTYYGGIDEAAADHIIQYRLLSGKIVEDIAYHPIDGRQTLRTAPAEI